MRKRQATATSQQLRKIVKRGSTFVKPNIEKDVSLLKRQMLVNAPPIKTTYYVYSANPTNEWTAMGLNWPVLGGSNVQRLGQDIKIKSIQIKGLMDVSSSDGFDTMRFVLLQYLDSNTSANFPYGTLDNLVKNTFMQPSNSDDYPFITTFRTQTKSSYRVLYDKSFNLSSGGQASANLDLLITSKDLAVKKIHYLDNDDESLNLPAVSEGMIVGLWCSDSNATPNPKIEAYVKLNYTDS